MSSYHGWTHAPKADGGTDPVPFPTGGTSAARLHDLAFDAAGDEDVAADTWELITAGNGNRFFLEGWRSDSDWSLAASGVGGNFQRNEFALYEAWASVEFGNAVEGDKIGVAIQFAASSDFFYPNVNVCEEDEARVIVAAHWYGTLSTQVKFYCYASVVRALRQAELVVRRFELNDDGELLDFS